MSIIMYPKKMTALDQGCQKSGQRPETAVIDSTLTLWMAQENVKECIDFEFLTVFL